MKQETLLNLLGIIGLLLAPSGFIEGISPFIKYPSFIAGIIAVGFYAKLYYDEKIITLIEQNKANIKRTQDEIFNMKMQLEKIKGWMEATQHFLPFKQKKGVLDPIMLIVLIIIIIIIIVLIQKGS